MVWLGAWLACSDPDADKPKDTAVPATETDADADADSDADADADTDTDTDTDADADTDTDTGSAPGPGIAEARVSVHPTMGSLLVVEWVQDPPCRAQTEVVLEDGARLIGRSRDEAGPVRRVVAGVPFDHAATVEVTDACGHRSGPLKVRTGPLPEGVPVPTLIQADPPGQDPAMAYHLSSTEQDGGGTYGWTTLIDRQARVIWAWRTGRSRITMQAQLDPSGDFLWIDENAFWGAFDAGDSTVVALDLEANLLQRVATPGLHHPFCVLPDGSVAWGARGTGFGGALFGNETLEIRDPAGVVRTHWDCSAALGEDTNCGSNTLRYFPDRGVYLYSFYSLETVFEIDGATGETRRSFGQLPGSYAFDPPESAFWWQHSANYTSTGTLLVSTKDRDEGDETLVREYEVDESGRTLRQVWSFGEGEGLYGDTEGEAVRLAGGNTLHNYGSLPVVREVTPDGRVVWEVAWARPGSLHRSSPLSADQLLQLAD